MRVSSGTVYKRGNVYWYDISIDGKRYQKSLHTSSRPEAYQRYAQIKDKAEGVWKSVIITFLETGIRAGDLAKLLWRDIDLKKRIISIAEAKSYKPRYIEISSRLINVLDALPKEGKKVFPFGTDYIIHKVARICKEAGLPDVTCHIFRHTFASRLIMAGVNLRTVQALLGHADIKTTMVYSHLAPDYLKGIGEKLGYKY